MSFSPLEMEAYFLNVLNRKRLDIAARFSNGISCGFHQPHLFACRSNLQPKLNPAVLACYLTAAVSGISMCSAEASWGLSMPVKRKLQNSGMCLTVLERLIFG